MATSGTIDTTMTARELCDMAAQDLGVYGAGENLSASDGAAMLKRLNWLLKTTQANGYNLWRETQDSVTFPAGTSTVTLDPFVLDVLEARYVQSSTYERPLQRWELGEYERLPNKNQPGYPIAFYLNKQAAAVTMTLWPVPYEDSTVRYTYSRVIEDVTDLNQTLDIPQIWLETIAAMLAARCVTMFGVTRLDPVAVQIVNQRAAMLEQKLLDQDRPASVFMTSIYDRYV